MLQPTSKGVVGKVLTTRREPDGGITFCLCGVLARGKEQFAPILPSLPGPVIAYHTEGRRHRVDNLIHSVLAELDSLKPSGPIRFVGASMGGMEVPFIIERFRAQNLDVDPARLHAVLVDAPCGLDSLLNPMAKFLPYIGLPLAHLLPSFVQVPVGDDALPKPDGITVPLDSVDPEAYKREIIEKAKVYMSGYSLSQLIDQTRWMIKVGGDGSLARACKALDGSRTTYVRCTRSNDVVKPFAADHWRMWVSDLELVDVPATHCGFLQNQPEFRHVLNRIFARV